MSAADLDASEVAEALRDAVGKLVRSVRQNTGTSTNAQSDVLASLARSGHESIAKLAESRGVTHQSMRVVVGKLEDTGLIERRPDPLDGRGYLIALTEEGKRLTIADQRSRAAWLTVAIDSELSGSERQTLAKAVPLLKRLATFKGS